MSEAADTVDFTLLEETGPNDTLLFGCKRCPEDKKITSHMLEAHMRAVHQATKFTVDPATAIRGRTKRAPANGHR